MLAARGSVDLRHGRFESAPAYYDRAVNADPFDSALRYQRMLILSRLGRKTESAAELRAVDQLHKDEKEFERISICAARFAP